jgi:hypothetical protein
VSSVFSSEASERVVKNINHREHGGHRGGYATTQSLYIIIILINKLYFKLQQTRVKINFTLINNIIIIYIYFMR